MIDMLSLWVLCVQFMLCCSASVKYALYEYVQSVIIYDYVSDFNNLHSLSLILNKYYLPILY